MKQKDIQHLIGLIVLSHFAEQLWQPFEWFGAGGLVDLFPFYDPTTGGKRGMNILFYISEMGEILSSVIWRLFALKLLTFFKDYSHYKPLKIFAFGSFFFKCVELVVFFLSYCTWDYAFIYGLTAVITIWYGSNYQIKSWFTSRRAL